MQIERCRLWKADLSLSRPYRIAGKWTKECVNAFFRIDLANGKYGIGSASPSERVCGETMAMTLDALSIASELLTGRDLSSFGQLIDHIDSALANTPGALCAVNIALYDAYCKSLGVGIVQLMGKRYNGIPTSVTIGIKEADGVRSDLDEYLGMGFRHIKVKIGDDINRDIEIIRKMREWSGKGFFIRVDANQGYSEADLTTFIGATRDLGVEFVEQPFAAPASRQMEDLDPLLRQNCMADEDLTSLDTAIGLTIAPIPYGMWNIKLMKSGGITISHRIGLLAGLHDIPLMWGCMDESRISIAAALHVAYACRTTRFLDLDGSFDLEKDIVSGGFEVHDGKMYLSESPGLGVELK